MGVSWAGWWRAFWWISAEIERGDGGVVEDDRLLDGLGLVFDGWGGGCKRLVWQHLSL